MHRFCAAAAQSYYRVSRESQYKDLERKIIIEQDLSLRGSAPVDYKFFCARGEVLFCQVDVDRFSTHRRALMTATFERIDVRYKYDFPIDPVVKPANFDRMVAIARMLSSYFTFVRVDLYSVHKAVFLGELTFAPEAGTGSLSSEALGVSVMERVRQANRPERSSIYEVAASANIPFGKKYSHEHGCGRMAAQPEHALTPPRQ